MLDKEYIELLEKIVKEFYNAGMFSFNGVLDSIDDIQYEKAHNLADSCIKQIRLKLGEV